MACLFLAPALLLASPGLAANDSILLPDVSMRMLDGLETSLQAATQGHPSLLVLSFQRNQRADMESWMVVDEETCGRHPTLRRISLALLPSGIRLLRRVIDPAIAESVGAEHGCGRTATAYLDKRPLLQSLAVQSEDEVLIILLSGNGTELWRGSGAATPESVRALESHL